MNSARQLRHINTFFILLAMAGVLTLISCQDDDDDDPGVDQTPVVNPDLGVGGFSEEYLRADQYTALEVEIAYESNSKPSDEAIDSLKSFLSKYLHKPSGINIIETNIPDQNNDSVTLNMIKSIENTHRSSSNSQSSIAAFFYFADAPYSEDSQNSKTLGVAYGNSSMCIFHETIRNNSGGIGQVATNQVEEVVIKHEFAHILGLVNVGTPMVTDHQDEAHGKHCDIQDCLMYYATETGDLFSMLLGSDVPTLDLQCQEDLRSHGGK